MKLTDKNLRVLDGFTNRHGVCLEQDLRLGEGVYPRATAFRLSKKDLQGLLLTVESKQRAVTNEQ
jgi:hypothetical protein